MTEAALRHRTRVDGPWQVILPGVYLSHTGALTQAQRNIAAWLYAGRDAFITGMAALEWHGIRVQQTGLVDVLVPLQRKRRDIAFVRLHRTAALPKMIFPDGEICYVPVVRAVADAVRELREADEVRAVVAAAVQRGTRRSGSLPMNCAGGRSGAQLGSGGRWRRSPTGCGRSRRQICAR